MTAIFLPMLFTLAAGLAVGSMLLTLRSFGAAAWALGRQLDECPSWREVRVVTRGIELKPEGARILRPSFRRPRTAHLLSEAA
ncbi:MAG TPA: hypothetical protein VGE05_05935 [Novosphingobium sp.]